MPAHRKAKDGGEQSRTRSLTRSASAMVVRFLDHLESLPLRDWHRALDAHRRAEARGGSPIYAIAAAGRAERETGLEQNVLAAQESVRRICETVDWSAARGLFAERDRHTVEQLAEWAAMAIVVRGLVSERAFRALYAPFASVIPLASLESARRPKLTVDERDERHT
jgi:hypothetical protein